MSRKRYTPEQIISMLREAEVALAQGQSVVVLGTILRSGRCWTDRQKAASFASMNAMMMSSSLPLALMTVCSRLSSR